MKQLLIVGETILAVGPFVDDGENIRAYTPEGKADAVYPKHVMSGHAVVTTGLPADFSCSGYLWKGGLVKRPPVVIPPTREELKQQRDAAVDANTVEVNGKVFDGNEVAQARMTRALKVAEITGMTTVTWVLADNTAATVTVAELSQALALSMLRQGELWQLNV